MLVHLVCMWVACDMHVVCLSVDFSALRGGQAPCTSCSCITSTKRVAPPTGSNSAHQRCRRVEELSTERQRAGALKQELEEVQLTVKDREAHLTGEICCLREQLLVGAASEEIEVHLKEFVRSREVLREALEAQEAELAALHTLVRPLPPAPCMLPPFSPDSFLLPPFPLLLSSIAICAPSFPHPFLPPFSFLVPPSPFSPFCG
jgi:hypothetical protein